MIILRLEHAQQLGLDRERQLADLVEEHRAAVRALEQARLGRDRAGERALLVAEQLALDQRLRPERRAVDRDERSACASTSGAPAYAAFSLPTPVSPVISTGSSDAASRSSSANTRSIAGSATSTLPRAELDRASRASAGSATVPGPARRAALRAASRIVSASHGIVGHIASPARAPVDAERRARSAIARAVVAIDLGQQQQRLAVVAVPTTSISRSASERAAPAARAEHRDHAERALERDRALELLGEPPPPARPRRSGARDRRGGVEKCTTSTTSPTVATSPDASTRASPTGSPLTRVPLWLPRSAIRARCRRRSRIVAWRRDTDACCTRSSASGARPITTAPLRGR